MNTKIEFMYRDGANFKTFNTSIIEGHITPEEINIIMNCLTSDGCFIPEAVGLDAERWNEFNPDLDHPWCELWEDSFSPTENVPTVNLTAAQLVAAFTAAKDNWDKTAEDTFRELTLGYSDSDDEAYNNAVKEIVDQLLAENREKLNDSNDCYVKGYHDALLDLLAQMGFPVSEEDVVHFG